MILKKWGEAALDLLFPPLCIDCEKPVPDYQVPLVCAECLARIAILTLPVNLPHLDHPILKMAHAPLVFEGRVREWIHGIKFEKRIDLLPHLVFFMQQAPINWKQYDLIVPVPGDVWRTWRRGYHLPYLLAEAISKKMGVPFSRLLQKRGSSKTQTTLPLEERLKNVEGTIQFSQKSTVECKQKRILLIDDIVTTGATAKACTKQLKQAEATSVDLLAIARTL